MLRVRGVRMEEYGGEKRLWLCRSQWSPPIQMGWGMHVFEEPVLRRYYWVLGWGLYCPILQL